MTNVTISPYLCVTPAAEALEFYKKAFGAVELGRQTVPTGEISHCHARVGDATFFLADAYPPEGWAAPSGDGHSVGIQLQVQDSKAVFDRAVAAGATVTRDFKSDEYGDWGIVVDPFGHYWTIIRMNEEFGTENVAR